MDNEQSVLNQLFVSKEENICALNKYDKKRIKELTRLIYSIFYFISIWN